MVTRRFKCPLCSSAFRNESGMNWHIAHRHEVPVAFEVLRQKYEAVVKALREENFRLYSELELMRMILVKGIDERAKVVVDRFEDALQILMLRQDLQKWQQQ